VVVDPAHPFVEGDDGVGMPAGDLKEVGVVSGKRVPVLRSLQKTL
jgi:hypothetical protein